MTTYLLGGGPINLSIYRELSRERREVFLVTSYFERFSHQVKTLTYEAFSENSMTAEDRVVIGWRSLNFSKSAKVKQNTLEHLNTAFETLDRVIYLSSGSIYGIENIEFKENRIPKPISLYARDKLELEKWIANGAARNKIICRISNVFGDPEFNDLINKIIQTFKSDSFFSLYNPDAFSRDYLSVQDLSKIVVYFLFSYCPDSPCLEYVNVSSNISVTTSEIIEVLSRITSRKISLQTLEVPSGVPLHNLLDNTKLTNQMNWVAPNPILGIENYIRARLAID